MVQAAQTSDSVYISDVHQYFHLYFRYFSGFPLELLGFWPAQTAPLEAALQAVEQSRQALETISVEEVVWPGSPKHHILNGNLMVIQWFFFMGLYSDLMGFNGV